MSGKFLNEELENHATRLLEEKWGEYLDGIDSDVKKAFTAILLENTDKALKRMDESTRTVNVGTFTKYIFPVVRAVVPNLIAQDIVSVQPMTGPTSQIFYFDILYGTSKGQVSAGQKLFDAQSGPSMIGNTYSSERVDTETDVPSPAFDGVATGPFTFTLSFRPVVPRTIVITVGSVVGQDDGNGHIVGTGISAGTINYSTGLVSLTFTSAPSAPTTVLASYTYAVESVDVPELDILLSSLPVTAQKRRLRARWSLEAAQDLMALFGIDADVEVTAAMAEAIKAEIDREVIADLFAIAPSGAGTIPTFHTTPGSGISYTEWKLQFIDSLVYGSNAIFKATKRAVGNFVIAGVDVSSIIETLPGFVPVPGALNQVGVVKIGTLNARWDIFKDPYITSTNYLVGHKGSTFLDTGYVYAPYIPLYTTPTVVLDDFLGRKGVGTQYAKKIVNSRFYASGNIAP